MLIRISFSCAFLNEVVRYGSLTGVGELFPSTAMGWDFDAYARSLIVRQKGVLFAERVSCSAKMEDTVCRLHMVIDREECTEEEKGKWDEKRD